jgi:hypothetical protein
MLALVAARPASAPADAMIPSHPPCRDIFGRSPRPQTPRSQQDADDPATLAEIPPASLRFPELTRGACVGDAART